ncbi:MAG: septum formation initiator family protein [Clostridia bacterium]|nr:septum formation initiator family protein [Clostridia bacterium]
MANSVKTGKKINLRVFTKRILFCFLFIYLLVSLISQQFNFASLKKQNQIVDAKLEEALSHQEQLKAQFEAIDSEDYIRRVIRERLGYTRPNETVFVDATK